MAMQVPRRSSVAIALLLAFIGSTALAQNIRDRVRLSKDKQTPITEAQANELTLTLNDAAVRPIQIWVRTAGMVDRTGRSITAVLLPHEAGYVKVGQRVRRLRPMESHA